MLMRRSHLIRRFLPLAIAVSLLSVAQGATWVLANGDRLNGQLVRETATAIEIEHPQLGRISLPKSGLQGSVTDAVAAAAAAKTDSLPSTPTTASSSKPAAARPNWTRQIEVGFVMQEGAKSTRDLNARAQVEGRWRGNSVRSTLKMTRAESEGRVTRDRDEADLRLRRDFNRRTFAQALTTYSSDDIRRIDLSLEQQIGGGYRLVDGERQKMNVGLGAVVQRFERDGYEEQTALLGSAFQDYAFSWNDRFKITQESSVQFADRAPVIARNTGSAPATLNAPANGNYRFKFNTALSSKMTQQISLNLRFEYDFDRSIAEPDLRADTRLTTSLGYAW